MLLEHQGKRPHIHETAYIAPTATICGDVAIGAESRVLFGAVLVAEGGPVTIGGHCIIMEQAVLRGTARHPVRLADHILVGPHAHLTGCTVEESVFVATGACVFNGRVSSCAATIKVVLDQPPKQFVDLDSMVADRLRDVRVANLFLGTIRQGGTRQIAFGQRAESTSVHRHPLP
jgi:tetrahydrodipicolinate N-succinyltransferase